MEQPPQLAGLFAGGMPKLKKRGGGVNTGGRSTSMISIMRTQKDFSKPRFFITWFRSRITTKCSTKTTYYGCTKTSNWSTNKANSTTSWDSTCYTFGCKSAGKIGWLPKTKFFSLDERTTSSHWQETTCSSRF